MASPCTTLPQIIQRQAEECPHDTALWWQGTATSYRELAQSVEALARRLAAICEPGARIGVLSFNSPQFLELIYAVPAAGCILVPLNARLAPPEWINQLRRTDCRLLFGADELLSSLCEQHDLPGELTTVGMQSGYPSFLAEGPQADLPTVSPEDPAWILFTSGSTGKPKGAVLTHGGFMAGLASALLARPVEPTDRYFYPFPLFHVAAHNVLLQHLYGAAVVLTPSFDAADTIGALRELGVTTMSLAPTMIAMLMEHPEFTAADLDAVRTIGYGASAMPESLLRRLLQETRVGLCQSYGMTELCGSVAFLTVQDHERALAQPQLLKSVGKPLPTAEIRLLDDAGNPCASGEPGEIVVRAAQCMAGYWHDSDASAAALQSGWLHTGDIGRFDDKGYLYIVDRKKDMVLTGGENVASREVEEVLRQHPAVRDCAVIGLPDEYWGETVCAVVQLREEVEDDSLSRHCRASLAGYKTPKRWIRVAALPLNASGKVDKPGLRARYG